jgi:alanyl-tRNA synthetase
MVFIQAIWKGVYILRRILRRLTLALKFLEIEIFKIEELIKTVIDKYSPFLS